MLVCRHLASISSWIVCQIVKQANSPGANVFLLVLFEIFWHFGPESIDVDLKAKTMAANVHRSGWLYSKSIANSLLISTGLLSNPSTSFSIKEIQSHLKTINLTVKLTVYENDKTWSAATVIPAGAATYLAHHMELFINFFMCTCGHAYRPVSIGADVTFCTVLAVGKASYNRASIRTVAIIGNTVAAAATTADQSQRRRQRGRHLPVSWRSSLLRIVTTLTALFIGWR